MSGPLTAAFEEAVKAGAGLALVGDLSVMLVCGTGADWCAWASRFEVETMTSIIREAVRDDPIEALQAATQLPPAEWMNALVRDVGR